MKILLFGVSNVGKTTIGKLLADRLGVKFYDLDEEVQKRMRVTLEEFINTADLKWRDQKRGSIIKKILRLNEDMVFAISPVSYTDNFQSRIFEEGILTIELYDSPENIFSRLVFSDENDVLYTDEAYKSKHREYYLKEIQEDLAWYGKRYAEMGIRNRQYVANNLPEDVVERIIEEYDLKRPREDEK